MSRIVDGFQNQIWRVVRYDGLIETEEERIPVDRYSVSELIEMLTERAKSELSPSELRDNPQLYEVRADFENGNRLMLFAGGNPHYVADLWRGDELAARLQ